jgi:hypothetical protein
VFALRTTQQPTWKIQQIKVDEGLSVRMTHNTAINQEDPTNQGGRRLKCSHYAQHSNRPGGRRLKCSHDAQHSNRPGRSNKSRWRRASVRMTHNAAIDLPTKGWRECKIPSLEGAGATQMLSQPLHSMKNARPRLPMHSG